MQIKPTSSSPPRLSDGDSITSGYVLHTFSVPRSLQGWSLMSFSRPNIPNYKQYLSHPSTSRLRVVVFFPKHVLEFSHDHKLINKYKKAEQTWGMVHKRIRGNDAINNIKSGNQLHYLRNTRGDGRGVQERAFASGHSHCQFNLFGDIPPPPPLPIVLMRSLLSQEFDGVGRIIGT